MLSEAMRGKLAELTAQYEELGEQLAQPEVIVDPRKMRDISKARARLEPVVELYHELQRIEGEVEEGELLLAEGHDAELAAEVGRWREQHEVVEAKLEEELAPRDPDDDRDCLLEVRAGTGGEEAALFAGDLLRMYLRYAERVRWKTETMSVTEGEHGGYKEAIVS